MNAPIASPDGKGAGNNVRETKRERIDERAIWIDVCVAAFAMLRWGFKECVVVPLYPLTALTGGLVMAPETVFESGRKASFWQAVVLNFAEFWMLTFVVAWVVYALSPQSRNRTLILSPSALIRRERTKDIAILWKRVRRVLFWSGDVLIVTFGGSTFVPREAFASSEQAREFVQIARELARSNDKSWRDEWNGKTFGVVPETARPNLPK